eukprot:1354563-Amorphochlora_amoeboformis.AAC.1
MVTIAPMNDLTSGVCLVLLGCAEYMLGFNGLRDYWLGFSYWELCKGGDSWGIREIERGETQMTVVGENEGERSIEKSEKGGGAREQKEGKRRAGENKK